MTPSPIHRPRDRSEYFCLNDAALDYVGEARPVMSDDLLVEKVCDYIEIVIDNGAAAVVETANFQGSLSQKLAIVNAVLARSLDKVFWPATLVDQQPKVACSYLLLEIH